MAIVCTRSAAATDRQGFGFMAISHIGGVFIMGGSGLRAIAPTSIPGAGVSISDCVGGAVNSDGTYRLIRSNGDTFNFGCSYYAHGAYVAAIKCITACLSTKDGFWVMDDQGHVYTYGGAQYYGGAPGGPAGCATLIGRPQGDGYWIIHQNGTWWAFGGATTSGTGSSGSLGGGVALGDDIITGAGEAAPNGAGWLAMDLIGHVYGAGGIAGQGDIFTIGQNGKVGAFMGGFCIDGSGGGYWGTATNGNTYAFGDAIGLGNPPQT